jgi:hypothetical protein
MYGACQKKCPPIFGGPFKHHHNSCTTTCPPIADLGRVSPPGRGSEKRARKGGGAPERAREKIINVYTRCNSANGRVIRNYPILSDFFGKITRQFHRRGIYFCTFVRTSFSRCWCCNQAGWMAYSERDDSRLVYSCGMVESRQLVRSIAGAIEFDDGKFRRRTCRLPHYRPDRCKISLSNTVQHAYYSLSFFLKF